MSMALSLACTFTADEFQDTNEPQHALCQLLKGDKPEDGCLFVVGDSDQSIYR